MHFLRIQIFNFFTQIETSYVSFLLFLVIQWLFFKSLTLTNLKNCFFFLCFCRWELESFSPPLARTGFFIIFLPFFHSNQDFKRLFFIFLYFRDLFFFQISFLPILRTFICPLFSIDQKKKITCYDTSMHFWSFFYKQRDFKP